jgi:hypothetical protein
VGHKIQSLHRGLQWSIVLPLLINPLLIPHLERSVGLGHLHKLSLCYIDQRSRSFGIVNFLDYGLNSSFPLIDILSTFSIDRYLVDILTMRCQNTVSRCSLPSKHIIPTVSYYLNITFVASCSSTIKTAYWMRVEVAQLLEEIIILDWKRPILSKKLETFSFRNNHHARICKSASNESKAGPRSGSRRVIGNILFLWMLRNAWKIELEGRQILLFICLYFA